jgi:hypothetical protein
MRRDPDAMRNALTALVLLAATVVSAGDSYHLDRASIDHAGGGAAESPSYQMVIAIGQHDADVESVNAGYRYVGGVFAQVPTDVLFKNDFEGD